VTAASGLRHRYHSDRW